MRKIDSKHKEEKNKRRNQIIVGAVLVFLMFASVLGYAFQGGDEEETEEKIIYNGFEFFKMNNFWVLEIKGYNFVFQNNPNQVEKINFEVNSLNSYSGKPLYIYSEDSNAEIEIAGNLDQVALRLSRACPENEKCGENIPVKNCSNNFIIIKKSEENSILQEENCVFIRGKKDDLIKVSDEFLFKVIGVE